MWPTAPKNTVPFPKSPFPVFCTAGSRWHFCEQNCDFSVPPSQLPNPLDLAPQNLWRVWQHCCAWQKNTHLACSALHGAHSATPCPKCTIRQWGALTGHLRCIFFCPPATGYPAGAAETHAPAAPASAPLWAAALHGCAAQPRVLLRPQQTTAECATAGATSTNATGRRRVAGCDVHVSHSCAGAQAARSLHGHTFMKV